MAHIIAIGVATVDIVTTVGHFPGENSKVRASAREIRRGGNATNTLVVLSQLGHQCRWAGSLADTPESAPIITDLAQHGIDMAYCRRDKQSSAPTSYIIFNSYNGSRTIVHWRDLEEFTAEDFAPVDLAQFDWIHFEGRNIDQTRAMLQRIKSEAPALEVSLEVEQARTGVESLIGDADLVLYSQHYAQQRGCEDPERFLQTIAVEYPNRDHVCAWGVAGAAAVDRAGRYSSSPSYPPPQIVDTVGAGDTFNAAVIDARVRGYSLDASIARGCRLAGKKCGQPGFNGLSVTDLE